MKKGCALCKKGCEYCPLYRRGIRLVGLDQHEEKYEGCVFNILADNVEELHRKVASMQAEVGETKNANIFQALAILTDSAGAKDELRRIIVNQFKETKRIA